MHLYVFLLLHLFKNIILQKQSINNKSAEKREARTGKETKKKKKKLFIKSTTIKTLEFSRALELHALMAPGLNELTEFVAQLKLGK